MTFDKLELQLERCNIMIDDIICRGIGLDEKICFDEFIRAAEFEANFPTKKFKTQEAQQRAMTHNIYYQYVKIFTADAVSQWFELTDGIVTSKLNPVWFSGHKIYEIPVKARTFYSKSYWKFVSFLAVLVKAWTLRDR